VGDDFTARLPVVDTGTGAQHDAGQIGADDVIRQIVALGVLREAPVALEKLEGRHRLEDRGPDRVVVDRAGHDRHKGFAGGELGDRNVVEVEALAGILVLARHALEHVHVLLVDRDGLVRVGQFDGGEFFATGICGLNGIENVLHVVLQGS